MHIDSKIKHALKKSASTISNKEKNTLRASNYFFQEKNMISCGVTGLILQRGELLVFACASRLLFMSCVFLTPLLSSLKNTAWSDLLDMNRFITKATPWKYNTSYKGYNKSEPDETQQHPLNWNTTMWEGMIFSHCSRTWSEGVQVHFFPWQQFTCYMWRLCNKATSLLFTLVFSRLIVG